MAAAIYDSQGNLLIAQRQASKHQGGLWEFPGGKVEANERSQDALTRELKEELGICVQQCRPLIGVNYDYPDRHVYLDVWRIDAFSGQPHGAEGQQVRWVSPESLANYQFPPANRPILRAAILPAYYLITPEPGGRENWSGFLAALEKALLSGIRLVQFRAKQLSLSLQKELAALVLQRCQQYGAYALFNGEPDQALAFGFDGVHLSSRRLMQLDIRPLSSEKLVAASCHSTDELVRAGDIDCDFAVAGPVQTTLSHPGAPVIGWDGFDKFSTMARMPLYALGGMSKADVKTAWEHGGQGIAAIRALWEGERA